MSFLHRGNIIFSKGFIHIATKQNNPPSGFEYRKLGDMLNMTLGEIANVALRELAYVKTSV